MTFAKLLNFYDFSYEEKPDGYAFVDLQGGSSSITDERYSNPLDMIDRLYESPYGDDYLFDKETLEEEGCKSIEEYIDKFGDDKEGHPYLYYSRNSGDLDDIPPTLEYVEKAEEIAGEFEEFANECGEYEFGSGAKWFDYENYDCGETISKITNVLYENKQSPYGNVNDLLKYLELNKENWQEERHDMSFDEMKNSLEYFRDRNIKMTTIGKDSNNKQKGAERG